MRDWFFDVDGDWRVRVDGAPTEETKPAFWATAVPQIAGMGAGPGPRPSVVVARVTAPPAPGRAVPAGPRGRAKGLLDALHDDRGSGPRYRELGAVAPLLDDNPAHVAGLAVEVRAGAVASVEYRLGSTLVVSGGLAASVDVPLAAPNDIVGTPAEKVPIGNARLAFAEAMVAACAASDAWSDTTDFRALVVRHLPARDEDNTWATWAAALCGTAQARPGSPWAHAPARGWAPMAFASLSEARLGTPTRFEAYR